MAIQIVAKQKETVWGEEVLDQLSGDLRAEIPDMKWFSKRNLELMRQWYTFWSRESSILQQLVAQIPWGHNLVIISKSHNPREALFYVQKTIQKNWPRVVLTHQIESGLYDREGKAITNFQTIIEMGFELP